MNLWIYFDASALVKRYASETGTDLVNEIFSHLPPTRMTCSTISILEIISVLVRKRNDAIVRQLHRRQYPQPTLTHNAADCAGIPALQLITM